MARTREGLPVVLDSHLPIVAFFAVAFSTDQWSRFFGIGQAWKRITGTPRLATATFNITGLAVLTFDRKRREVWTYIVLNGLMLAMIIFRE